jgi:cysteine-rich repeat protein
VDCKVPRCGDGVVGGYEECDDGNDDSSDACVNCYPARCGDGSVQAGVEECDDPYGSACSLECRAARCGDGEIRPYAEACDDGNTIDDDACPNDCSKATCGDGYTSRGFEECDYNDSSYISACTPECKIPSICGDANGNDLITATDARLVLQQAIGLDVGCPREVCDMDASGRITAADAKMDLHKAVGLNIGERCSIGTGHIVFWMDDAQTFGALQFEIDYEETGGNFAGAADTVGCELLVPVLASFNDDEAEKKLGVGIISLGGIHGHIDLFRCAFEMPEDRTGVEFHFNYIDAASPELEPIEAPLIGYRLE